jgi:hypothetical protein
MRTHERETHYTTENNYQETDQATNDFIPSIAGIQASNDNQQPTREKQAETSNPISSRDATTILPSFPFTPSSSAFSLVLAETAAEIHVARHDGHSLGVDGAQVRVLEHSHQIGLHRFLHRAHRTLRESHFLNEQGTTDTAVQSIGGKRLTGLIS